MSNESKNDDLLSWRDEFPISKKTRYLINNSLGAFPLRSKASALEYLRLWEELGVSAWAEGWWDKQNEVARALSPILGVNPAAISMHQNVTIASSVFSSSIDFSGKRNKIVYTALNFPSLIYLYNALARQRGAEIHVVQSSDGITIPTQTMIDAIDERTALVPISHVLFRSAYIQDAKAIIEKARKVGAIVLLDVFQSVGTVPLDLALWGCHAAVGGALKFLCGGPGACFLYVSSELCTELAPAFTGWMAHKKPFDFDPGPMDHREDGWRFLHGTPNVPALYTAIEGIKIIAEIGVARIRKNSLSLTQLLIDRALDAGFDVRTPMEPHQRGGTVCVNAPHGFELCQELISRGFKVDYRPGAGVRMAPHFYTSEEDCIATIDKIRTILASGAHERHIGQAQKPG